MEINVKGKCKGKADGRSRVTFYLTLIVLSASKADIEERES